MLNVDEIVPKYASYKSVGFTERFSQLVARRGHRSMTTSRSVTVEEARFLAGKLRAALGETTDDSAVLRVLEHNPEIVRLAEREDGGEPGFIAYLPLNSTGMAAFTSGHRVRIDPDPRFICKPGEQPVALYMWCVYAPGNFIPAIAAIAAHFEQIAPGGVPLFTRGATPPSARLFASLGFVDAVNHYPAIESDVLVVFAKQPSAPTMPLARNRSAAETTTRIAHTIEDIMRVFSIRAATFIADQACPYAEEFDGNDFCAAHILGDIKGEPAGCIRIRFFGSFVKFERLAVRPEFRNSSMAFRLVRAAIDYARTKGFSTVYGHARHDLVAFWERFGFQPMTGRPMFHFSDVDYIEMTGNISPAARPIGLDNSPYELIRPEGAWDQPGLLDESAARRGSVMQPRRASAR